MRATGTVPEVLLEPVRRWRTLGARRALAPGAAVVTPGEPVSAFVYVESGLIQSTLLRPEGDHLIVERIGPGAVCAEGPCLHGLPPRVEMVAVEPSEVVVFARALMLELFARDPEFGRCIAEVVSLKYNRLLSRLAAATDRRPGERVLELFARLADSGTRHPRGRVVRTRLTHQDIAAMTGLSRVTITRTLAGLRQLGALEPVTGGYLLVDGYDAAAT